MIIVTNSTVNIYTDPENEFMLSIVEQSTDNFRNATIKCNSNCNLFETYYAA